MAMASGRVPPPPPTNLLSAQPDYSSRRGDPSGRIIINPRKILFLGFLLLKKNKYFTDARNLYGKKNKKKKFRPKNQHFVPRCLYY